MINVRYYSSKEWEDFSESAHLICFEEQRPRELNRVDYALLALEEDVPVGYVTVRELDSESVYWQYGGSMKHVRGTPTSFNVYLAFLEWTKQRYKRMTTYIENNNIPMLKFAMKGGQRVVGIRTFQGSIFLEHLLEFDKE